MAISTLVGLALLLVAVVYCVQIDNALVRLKHNVARALVINPAIARPARPPVRTADPTGHGVTVGSAVRTVRGRPER